MSKYLKYAEKEASRQLNGLELIPSENFASKNVRAALGSHFTNKYSEGYPHKRYYGGQENTDAIEEEAINLAKQLFRAEHANVQPLSGAVMNIAVYLGLLTPGDTIIGMDLSHGGHLTHGHPVTHMAKLFNFERYKTLPNGDIDYDYIEHLANTKQPKLILAGFSSYPKNIDWKRIQSIAQSCGALSMADVSHIGGLIAGNALDNPLDYGFDIMTTTTHKTLRGPRGGLILCKSHLAKKIDSSVFPGLQGGPLMNNVFAKLIAFEEALSPEFKQYTHDILQNAKALAQALAQHHIPLVFGGTENHLCLINVGEMGIGGKEAEQALGKAGITVNKNVIPDDPNPPMNPSGIRIGTPAITTRGMKADDMQKIAEWIALALSNRQQPEILENIRNEVEQFCQAFPLP